MSNTIVFWVLATTMLVVAVAWVVPSLLGRGRDPLTRRRAPNAKQHQRKLAALDKAKSDGSISAAEHETERRRLADELLNQLASDSPAKPAAAHSPLGTSIAMLTSVVVPAASIVLYLWLGRGEALEVQPQTTEHVAATQEQAGSIAEMVANLAQRLRDNPDDAEGWIMLGRSYMVMERYPQAADAYSQAQTLIGDEPDLLVDFAEAVTLANDNQMEGLPTRLLDRALAREPNHQKGIWLAGFAALQRNAPEQAVELWTRLLEQLPAGSREADAVNAVIAQAQGDPVPESVSEPVTQGASLAVTVTLDPALAAQVTGDETVFIFARAVDGPPMPLAIQRRAASELPVTVTLDDSTSMLPAMKLSAFPTVTIGARISKSGDAIGASGDLQGLVTPVDVAGTAAVEVSISEVVP